MPFLARKIMLFSDFSILAKTISHLANFAWRAKPWRAKPRNFAGSTVSARFVSHPRKCTCTNHVAIKSVGIPARSANQSASKRPRDQDDTREPESGQTEETQGLRPLRGGLRRKRGCVRCSRGFVVPRGQVTKVR